MCIKKIAIEELQVGMFLIDVDIPWFDTPFLRHKFTIKNQDQINELRKSGAKIITIDLAKSVQDEPELSVVDAQTVSVKTEIKNTSLRREMGRAKEVKVAVKNTVRRICATIKEGGSIDAAELSPAVDQTMESILRNNEALLTLIHQESTAGLPLSDHAFSVMTLALSIAQRLELSDLDLKQLGMAALLMDIGWLKLPEELFCFGSAYTEDEYELVRKHVKHSVELLRKNEFSEEIIELVACHHERFDGSGYPIGLGSCSIPLIARILSVADHYNSKRYGYYDSSSVIPAEALRAIYAGRQQGTHDPDICDLMVQLVGIYPMSSAVQLNTGERGVVTGLNWKTPLLPKVTLYYNKNRLQLMKPYVIDLSKQPDGEPQKSIKKLLDPSLASDDPAGILRFPEEY